MATTHQNGTTNGRFTEQFVAEPQTPARPAGVRVSFAPSLRSQVHDAFDHVAFGTGCPLTVLLAETRKRGIADEDVQAILSHEERDGVSGQGFYCSRTADGVGYVARASGMELCLASANELFAELHDIGTITLNEGPNSDIQSGQRPKKPPFRLSDAVREQGHELTELEATVLDVSQTLNPNFKNGKTASREAIVRVVRRYHADEIGIVTVERCIDDLEQRGVVRRKSDDRSVVELVQHFGPLPNPQKKTAERTRLSVLTDDPELLRLLKVCESCTGAFFARGVAAKKAVETIFTRYRRMPKPVFKDLVRRAKQAGLLESANVHSGDGLRLTLQARLMAKGQAETMQEAGEVAHVHKTDHATRFSPLNPTQTQQDILQACDHCCQKRLKNGGSAARAAVKALVMARHGLRDRQANKTLTALIDGRVLQETNVEGVSMLRLTPAARTVVLGKAETLNEAMSMPLPADPNPGYPVNGWFGWLRRRRAHRSGD